MTREPLRPNPTEPSTGLPFWTGAVVLPLLAAILVLVACTAPEGPPRPPIQDSEVGVTYWHDEVHHVGCWITYGNGPAMSCLPDSEYQAPKAYIGATAQGSALHRATLDVTHVAPSGMLGDYSSAVNPAMTEEPTPEPQRVTGIGGQATWWFSFGHGLYAALRPDLGTKGDTAIVCGGEPFHCLSLPVITSCACLGPGSKRLIDLSRDAFASFADPAQGTVHVVVQVIGQ